MDETEDDTSKRDAFSLMKDDPEYLLSLLDKYVKVDLIKSSSFNGFVHSIDPITKSMILSIPHKEMIQTTLIPGHAILKLSESSIPSTITTPTRKLSVKMSDKDISSRKEKIIAWLKKNLLPVTVDGDNIVVGTVNILFPYCVTDIYAENPVVALQIKNMIEKLPDDFEPLSL